MSAPLYPRTLQVPEPNQARQRVPFGPRLYDPAYNPEHLSSP
jgi:hypothetical protein